MLAETGPVLLRLMVRLTRREASTNVLTMTWRSDSLCAMRAQSSTNSASRTVFFTVFVLAVSRQRLNWELSSRYRKYTPCSRSLTAWFSTNLLMPIAPGHQRPLAIALCSGLLWSFWTSWSPAVSALLQCLASNCCEAGLSSSFPVGSRSGLGVWSWMLAS